MSEVSGGDHAVTTPMRLVMRADVGPARAALYDVDADRRDGPRFRFLLKAFQPVPRIEPGAIVEVRGHLAAGETPVISAAGTEIVPASPLEDGGGKGPMLQEDHRLIIHPDLTDWSPPTLERSRTAEATGWRRLLPRRRAEPETRGAPESAATPMQVELVYTTGPDVGVRGPVALAHLYEPGAAPDAEPDTVVPVDGNNGSLPYDARIACEVLGSSGNRTSIRVGRVELRPVALATTDDGAAE